METKRKPPNPNGNPNFRSRWDNLGETSTVRLPQSLHSVFKNLATDINDGKVKLSDLKSSPDILEKLNQFEEIQKQSWGKSANQRGEFSSDSPRWQKYNEFKAWLANQGE
jgi:hypothetical protein